MFMTDAYGLAPGATTARETYEAEFRWGSQWQGVYANGLIDAATVDSGNTPTNQLRPGLLLGQILATGKYTQYSATATNGSEVASAVLLEAFSTQDFSTSVGHDIFYSVLVGGPVQASKLLGLDNMARQQMDKFMFDDIGNLQGNHWFPWKRFQTKIANYTIVATDNMTMFDDTGTTGTVILTLPAIANGYFFGIRTTASSILRIASAEGSNMVGTTLTQSTASITAIGGVVYVYSNAAATKWIVEQHGTQTITMA